MSDILKSTSYDLPSTPTYSKVSVAVQSSKDDEKSSDSLIKLDKSTIATSKDKLDDNLSTIDDLKEASVEPQASDNESELNIVEQISENEIESDTETTTEYIAETDPDFYSQEMDLALENVRKLASYHQESVINSICDTFAHLTGKEASINDLAAVFNRIRATFADEAIEEELEMDQEYDSDDDEDSDYDPNSIRDRQQVQEDLYDDIVSDLEFDSDSEYESDSNAEDSDYNPLDADDLKQGQLDEADDYLSSADSELSETLSVEFDELEEDAIINLESFDAEYFAAIQCAQIAAKFDAAQIVKNIKNEYDEEYGEEQVSEIIDTVFKGIDLAQNEQIDESEDENDAENDNESESEIEQEVEIDVFEQEMFWALDNVRKLAKYHQQAFVEQLCDIYQIYNGFEPSVDEISSIFLELSKNLQMKQLRKYWKILMRKLVIMKIVRLKILMIRQIANKKKKIGTALILIMIQTMF